MAKYALKNYKTVLKYYKNQNEEHNRTQMRLIVTIYWIYGENVTPREATWSAVKCHTSHHLPLQLTSLKWKITRKRLRGRGGWTTLENGRSIFFLQSFVKSRPIEGRTSERVPFQIVSLKKPKMSSHIGMSSINTKYQLTLKILSSI